MPEVADDCDGYEGEAADGDGYEEGQPVGAAKQRVWDHRGERKKETSLLDTTRHCLVTQTQGRVNVEPTARSQWSAGLPLLSAT